MRQALRWRQLSRTCEREGQKVDVIVVVMITTVKQENVTTII